MAIDIFDVVNNIPVLTPEASAMPQFKKLSKEHEKCDYDRYVMYLYYVYCRLSMYFDMMPLERKQLVCKDQLKIKSSDYKKIEGETGMKDCISLLESLQFTANEKLFYGISQKVEEYLNFWQGMTISEKNHNIVAESVKNASMLVKLRDDLEKQIFRKNDD